MENALNLVNLTVSESQPELGHFGQEHKYPVDSAEFENHGSQ